MDELKEEKKLSKILDKIGVKSPAEIIDIDQIDTLVNNLSKLQKESLEQLIGTIPNFKEITTKYMENLNLSYNKVMDDLIEEKKALYTMLNKENLTDQDKVMIFNEIREIRRTLLLKDTMYNVMNNKVFQATATAAAIVVSAAIGSKLKK